MRSYGSNLTKRRRLEEDRLLTQIASLSNETTENLSEEELLQLSECQNKLDIYKQKAQGAFVRSRRKWLEKGEQNSSYFFCLEKSKLKNSSIDALKMNGKLVNDHKEIATFC